MAEKNIRKEAKKPKKSDKTSAASFVSSTPRPIAVQPELIKKEKKNK